MDKVINALKAVKILGINYYENITRPKVDLPILDSREKEILDAIKRDGYFFWKGFYSSDECKELRYEIDKLISQGKGLKVYGDSDFRIYAGNKYSAKIDAFNKNESLKKIGENFLETKAQPLFTLSAKIEFKEGNLGSGQGWHRDTYWPFQFKAMVYLTDVDTSTGPFEIIESSHTKSSLLSYALRNNIPPNKHRFSDDEILSFTKRFKKVTFTGNAGDLIIFNSYCIHRGAPLKKDVRYALTNYYFPEDFILKNRINLESKFYLG